MSASVADFGPVRRPRGLTALGMVLTLGAFTLVGGGVGTAAAVAVAGIAVLTNPLTAFVGAHLLLFLVAPDIAGLTFVLVEVALAPLLLASLPAEARSMQDRLLVALSFVGLAATVVVVRDLVDARWGEVGVVVGAIALLGYGIHRYELVRLDLVSESDP